MMLVVDCCVRGDASSTRQYYEAYLRKNGYTEENVAVLKLAEQDLAPLTNVNLEKRDALRYAGKYDDAMFDLARQFRDADEILGCGAILGSLISIDLKGVSGACFCVRYHVWVRQ